MEITHLFHSFSWGQVLGLMGGGLIVVTLIKLLISTRSEKMRHAFLKIQPNLRIDRSATIYSGGQEVVTFTIQNMGGSPAYDIRATIHGREGKEIGPVIPVVKPGKKGHCLWIRPAVDSPLLQNKTHNVRLTIDFQDYWGHAYDLRFPIAQQVFGHDRFTLHLNQNAQGRLMMRPWVSCFKMKKILSSFNANGYSFGTAQGNSGDCRITISQ